MRNKYRANESGADMSFLFLGAAFPKLNWRTCSGLGRPERVLKRWTARCKQLGAITEDVHVVFDAHAELTGQIDSRLITERHVGAQRQRVARYQIRPLVAIHSHTVAEPVGEVLEAWSIARIDYDLARRSIDGLALHTGLRGCQSGTLGPVDDLENLLHLGCRFSQDEGASDIGRVAFDAAAAV